MKTTVKRQCGEYQGPVYMLTPSGDTLAAYENRYNFNFAYTLGLYPVPSCRDILTLSRGTLSYMCTETDRISRLAGLYLTLLRILYNSRSPPTLQNEQFVHEHIAREQLEEILM